MIRKVGDISRVSAHLYGEKTALIIEDRQFSFSQIDAMACPVSYTHLTLPTSDLV